MTATVVDSTWEIASLSVTSETFAMTSLGPTRIVSTESRGKVAERSLRQAASCWIPASLSEICGTTRLSRVAGQFASRDSLLAMSTGSPT